ncbi:MAG: CBS domain-containing protein [Rubripirellula sp.]|nr:CBS domain-containing protein [Rubripirellula sp.]
MKRHAPDVRQFMTHLPVEAERCETAEQAWDLMEEHQIHHVPVMNGSQLRGVVSREMLLQAKVQTGTHFADCSVEQFCHSQPLVVEPVEPIDKVVRKMNSEAVDCALVMDGGFVVGVFTSTDVLRFVAEFFGQQ